MSKSEMDDAQVQITHLRLQLSEFINRNTLLMLQFEDSQRKVKALQTEVERLTKAHSDALADFWAIHKGYFDLKTEVERLRKTGDEMARCVSEAHEASVISCATSRGVLASVVKKWNADKDCKQP